MKYPIVFILFLSIANQGCDQKETKTGQTDTITATKNIDTIRIAKPAADTVNQSEPPAGLAHLSPLMIVEPTATNVFEKYGIEFSGNCYECDLAFISITKKNFDLVNVCNNDDLTRNEKFRYQGSSNAFTIEMGKSKFIFNRIDMAPVYELKVEGEQVSLKNKRLSKFYTLQKQLIKFKQHDCGEFDG